MMIRDESKIPHSPCQFWARGLPHGHRRKFVTLKQIQSVVRDPRPEAQQRKVARKVNPLRNRAVMLRLNPHHDARVKAQAEYQAAQKASRKVIMKERRARKGEGKKFYEKANREGDIKF